MNSSVIKIVNLTKNFGRLTAVENLNLEIFQGEIFAFLGPNGAGKTTTIKLLTGLLRPSFGEVFIAGYNMGTEAQKAKNLFGFVADQPFVFPYLTGFEFLRLVGDIYKVPINEQKEKIPELFDMFELNKWAGELIESYSHGMKQKLVIASVILHNPKVIFLDEPLVGLDPKSARLVKDIFNELSLRGTSIFMCTHVLEIAEKLAHRACIIDQGKIIALDTINELVKKRADMKGSLEDVFLELTGGIEYKDLLKFL